MSCLPHIHDLTHKHRWNFTLDTQHGHNFKGVSFFQIINVIYLSIHPSIHPSIYLSIYIFSGRNHSFFLNVFLLAPSPTLLGVAHRSVAAVRLHTPLVSAYDTAAWRTNFFWHLWISCLGFFGTKPWEWWSIPHFFIFFWAFSCISDEYMYARIYLNHLWMPPTTMV